MHRQEDRLRGFAVMWGHRLWWSQKKPVSTAICTQVSLEASDCWASQILLEVRQAANVVSSALCTEEPSAAQSPQLSHRGAEQSVHWGQCPCCSARRRAAGAAPIWPGATSRPQHLARAGSSMVAMLRAGSWPRMGMLQAVCGRTTGEVKKLPQAVPWEYLINMHILL